MQVTCSNSVASVCRNARATSFFRHAPFSKKGVSKSVSESLYLRQRGRQICVRTASARRDKISSVTQPSSCNDVDRDLWTVLDLASDEELEGVHDILFGTSLLSPLIKSLLTQREPAALKHRGRAAVMHRIEQRMRFLAADSASTLRGQYPSYRELLLRLCYKLEIKCPSTLITEDLETEVLMHILEQQEQSASPAALQKASQSSKRPAEKEPNILGRVFDRLGVQLKLSAQDMVPTAAKLGSAATMSSFRGTALKQLGTQVLAQHARYEAALAVVCKTGATYQKRAALQAAQQGFTSAAAKYSTARGILSFLGPAMWVWLGMDLALKAIGPDYARVVKAVSCLAQIRLLHTHGFINPVRPA
ncbi:TPA: hypothetical protein ACH3X2_009712 [Trebouxia sp. C0005]|nr:MAG: hypothetical protein FRX49_07962 [Trebouxia sp. A1-2]